MERHTLDEVLVKLEELSGVVKGLASRLDGQRDVLKGVVRPVLEALPDLRRLKRREFDSGPRSQLQQDLSDLKEVVDGLSVVGGVYQGSEKSGLVYQVYEAFGRYDSFRRKNDWDGAFGVYQVFECETVFAELESLRGVKARRCLAHLYTEFGLLYLIKGMAEKNDEFIQKSIGYSGECISSFADESDLEVYVVTARKNKGFAEHYLSGERFRLKIDLIN